MRKVFLHISAVALMVYMLVSSMGVLVYEHHCSQSGTFYGVFTEFDHECEKIKKEVSSHCDESQKSCCKKPSNKEKEQVKSNCCTTNVNWVQLDTDLSIHDVEFEFDLDIDISFVSNFKVFQSQSQVKIEECRGPPLKVLNPSLSTLQSYLI